MELVEPIRDRKIIAKFENDLRHNNLRDLILFKIGINSGLRISDLTTLRIEDVKGQEHAKVKERKTGKWNKLVISPKLQKMIREYIKTQLDDRDAGWLFPSRKTKDGKENHISTKQGYRVIKDSADRIGYKAPLGTHTLRKTYGYHLYLSGMDVTRIMALLNHSAPSVTLNYIGITREELDTAVINLDL